jgi:putative colanic acid biosynthesis acetyltransferase WcaF
MELTNKPIVIGPQAWVAARAFISPGVTVGEGAVVGACAVVTKDVEPWTVVAGNPAKFIKKREIKGPLSSSQGNK